MKVLVVIGLIIIIPIEWACDLLKQLVTVTHAAVNDIGTALLKKYNEPHT